MAVPHILPESNIKSFKFYDQQAIHEAVLVNNRILRLARVFPAEQKRAAFEWAYQLCQDYDTLITPSPSHYRVWVDVCCHQPPAAMPASPANAATTQSLPAAARPVAEAASA